MGFFGGKPDVQVSIQTLNPIPVVAYKYVGPYDNLSGCFDQLWSWVESHQVPATRTIGIYWDNPDVTPVNQLRSAACVEVPGDFQLSDNGGLPLANELVAGGRYAVTRFVGPYDQLAPVWTAFTEKIEGEMRQTIDAIKPAFEIYVNDAGTTPPDQLITELYMPLA